MEESGGAGLSTTSHDTVKATSLLARTEGIFAEPASASVIASLESAVSRGLIERDEVVVCVVTGAGLKDTKAITRLVRATKRVSVREDYALAKIQIGETKLALLRSLAERSRYGYELWQALSVRRSITTASIYQHLLELEELGLVARSNVVTTKGRERIPYDLTRKGADSLKIAGRLERIEESTSTGS
jgi:threonine synthase